MEPSVRIWRPSITCLTLPLSVGLLFLVIFVDLRTDPERQAEAEVCAALAAEVQGGTSTRFDYMATRCPARLLTVAEAQ